jgi:hypothetical protein
MDFFATLPLWLSGNIVFLNPYNALIDGHEVILKFIKDPNPDSLLIGEGTLDDMECAKTLIDHNGYVRKTIDKRFISDKELDKYIFAGEAIGMIKISKENRSKYY